jgi:hypothetical protein
MTEKKKKLDKKLQEKINKAGRSGPPFNPVIKESKPPKPVGKPKPPSKPNTNYKAAPYKAPPSKKNKNNNVTTTFSYGGFSPGQLYGMSDKEILKKHFPNIPRGKYFPKPK